MDENSGTSSAAYDFQIRNLYNRLLFLCGTRTKFAKIRFSESINKIMLLFVTCITPNIAAFSSSRFIRANCRSEISRLAFLVCSF